MDTAEPPPVSNQSTLGGEVIGTDNRSVLAIDGAMIFFSALASARLALHGIGHGGSHADKGSYFSPKLARSSESWHIIAQNAKKMNEQKWGGFF